MGRGQDFKESDRMRKPSLVIISHLLNYGHKCQIRLQRVREMAGGRFVALGSCAMPLQDNRLSQFIK